MPRSRIRSKHRHHQRDDLAALLSPKILTILAKNHGSRRLLKRDEYLELDTPDQQMFVRLSYLDQPLLAAIRQEFAGEITAERERLLAEGWSPDAEF